MKDLINSPEPTSIDSISSNMGGSGSERSRDLALCAVILDEWLKELSAISQEQNIVMLGDSLSYV